MASIEKNTSNSGTENESTSRGSSKTAVTSKAGGGSTRTSGLPRAEEGGSTSICITPNGGGSTGVTSNLSTSAASGSEKGKKNGKKKKGGTAAPANKVLTPAVSAGGKGPIASGASPAAESTEPGTQETWAKVLGRKERRKEKVITTSISASSNAAKRGLKGVTGRKDPAGTKKTALPAKAPRTAAVTVTVPAGSNTTYAAVLRKATTEIKLADLGIALVKPKGAANGGLILEIPGQDGATKAEKLAAKMTEILEGTGARVARPTKRAELRVRGLIPSITPEDVATAIANIGGCRAEDVQTGEIRSASSGLGTLWVRCPAAAARKLAVARKIIIGWTQVTVEALQARPLQCYKCLEVGHTREQCPSETDRSGRCYNCGDPSHKASACKASPKCPVCTDKGRPAAHRLGGRACTANAAGQKKKKGGRGKEKAAGAKAAAPAVTTAASTLASADQMETVAPEPPTAGPSGPEAEKMAIE